MDIKLIRNFSIIAHIDHGKSTLADRFIQICDGLNSYEMKEQVLDSMDIERERGITIKAQTVSLNFKSHNGLQYQLNIIDTPGHVDFSYEVSRSLASCEGALLVVDSSSSVQAQTLANCQTALKENLVIIPVLNKVDLPSSDIEKCLNDIDTIVKIDVSDYLTCSAKTGLGVKEILESIIRLIPCPRGSKDHPFRARIIDSWFDNYLGVVSVLRIYDGILRKRDKIKILSTGKSYEVDIIGIFTPKKFYVDQLTAGQVGFIVSGLKDIYCAPVGDTITLDKDKDAVALPGFKVSMPNVFAGMFPIDSSDFENFRVALQKLSLNDASLHFTPEVSQSLGHGFRCGFLGMLHMDIIRERLEREYNLNLIVSAPSVTYTILLKDRTELLIDNPSKLIENMYIDKIHEPISLVRIITPVEYLGNIMLICNEKFAEQIDMEYSGDSIILTYEMPTIEVIGNLSDKIKSASKGYASFEYSFLKFQEADIGVLNILINDEAVDALAQFMRKSQAASKGRILVEKLVKIIPKSMFSIKVQAAIGSTIVARGDIKAFRKDVTAKCYGGDFTRKRKLLEKQKSGKKRMKHVGKVSLPEHAFFAALSD